jgi:SAM-dependent methyltransferase
LSAFASYSRYYDLLYRDKDYSAEARYVQRLLERHAPAARDILELGCGTGAHAAELALFGYDVTGVDMSEGMLAAAEVRKNALEATPAKRVTFVKGDARDVRLGRRFGAVISLFHVMSYQTTNDDLSASFVTAREHLEPGGIFLFDCWYGPGVLTDRPSVTVKHLSDNGTDVTRVAEPQMRADQNVVDVNYTVTIADRATGNTETLRETHRMRYLFSPEVSMMLDAAGLTVLESREWMSDRAPGFNSWAACFIARG